MAKENNMPTDWLFWKNIDKSFIDWADELHVLCIGGWHESTGVQAEIEIAETQNKPVKYIWPED